MAKTSKPPSGALDIHAAIGAAAKKLRARATFGVRNASELPEVAALMDAASAAGVTEVPDSFEFHGRLYYLRARVILRMDIYDSPGAALPLLSGASFSKEDGGHAPGH
mgnify:FL=1